MKHMHLPAIDPEYNTVVHEGKATQAKSESQEERADPNGVGVGGGYWFCRLQRDTDPGDRTLIPRGSKERLYTESAEPQNSYPNPDHPLIAS